MTTLCTSHSEFCRKGFYHTCKLLGISSLLLLGGCASFQSNPTELSVQRQIERQQKVYELTEEPQKQEKLTLKEYEALGDRYLIQNDIEKAYMNYVKALAIDPNKISLLHKQGKILGKKNRHADAEKVYRFLLAKSEEDALAYEGLGQALLGLKKIKAAEDALLTAIALDDELWRAHHFLALIYGTEQQYGRAVKEFKKALSYRPQDSSLLNNLAVTYYLNGQYAEAEKILTILTRNSKDKKVYNNLAIVCVQRGKFEKALSAFKRGTKDEAYAYNNIGFEYLTHRRYKEAIVALEKALELNPQFYPTAYESLEKARKGLALTTATLKEEPL
ncbi:tetratricopeptide repeat protein [Desulfotalea psychrophila]|nr:tetratricopeptide repeat protein [Desulfotalea psychrophila]